MIRAARVLLIVTVVFALSGCTSGRQGRKVLRLDGNWQIAEGAMDASLAERIDTASIVAFFESDLGSILCDPHNDVKREWPFTFRLATSVAPPSSGVSQAEDFTIVQGLIDVLVATPQGLIVIDFKTDRVAGDDVPNRAEAYRAQLDLYAQAAERILGRPILQKWLYFLAPRQCVRM